MKTYTLTVVLSVDDHADEHLQTVQAVEGEVRSWLEGLGATVQTLAVTAREDRFIQPEDGIVVVSKAGRPPSADEGSE
jgi:hypothetical protein